MNKALLSALLVNVSIINVAEAQIDSTLLRSISTDTVRQTLNMDAVYQRTFLGLGPPFR